MKDIVIAVMDRVPGTNLALLAVVGGLIWVILKLVKSNLNLATEIEKLSTLLEIVVHGRRVLRRDDE